MQLISNPATIPGAASVAGNLAVGGTELVTGAVTAAGFITGAGLAQLTEGVGGSALTLAQCSGILTSPAATRARLYLRAGTTGVKIVALSSTGVEYPILDNIV